MKQSSLGALRAARHRNLAAQPTVSARRLDIALAVAGLAVGPGFVRVAAEQYEVPACLAREGLLYLALEPAAGACEIVLDDASREWSGALPGREVVLLGAVQGEELHLHRAVIQTAADDPLAEPPRVRTVAELLDERPGKVARSGA